MLVEKDAGNDTLKNEPVICKAPDRQVLIRAILTGKIKNKLAVVVIQLVQRFASDTRGPRFKLVIGKLLYKTFDYCQLY